MVQAMGMPPTGPKIREVVEERLKVASKENGEKLTFEWRGVQIHRHVIAMPTELLYYNPDTHRIRAQRSHDPARDAKLSADPWSEEGQSYLEFLLKTQPSAPGKTDPEFESLRDSLRDFDQQQPGLITPHGVLVNGNTRRAALREIGKTHIRVAVLPDDTTPADVSAVELALQLRRENKRDYSYINYLIAIEEQLAQGRKPDEIARSFHIRAKTLEQDRWVYSLIQDAIARSQTPAGSALRLVDFEDHQEKLRELYRAYVAESAVNRDSAESLKETRLALIVLDFSKTDVRLAKPDFMEKYLKPKLPASVVEDADSSPGSTPVAIPGLGATVAGDSAELTRARAIADQVLRARAVSNTGADEGLVKSSSDVISKIKDSANDALNIAGRDERLRQRKVAAADRIGDAAEAIQLAAGDIAQALATNSVDEEVLDEALSGLRKSMIALTRQVRRSVKDPGDGASWLLGINTVGE